MQAHCSRVATDRASPGDELPDLAGDPGPPNRLRRERVLAQTPNSGRAAVPIAGRVAGACSRPWEAAWRGSVTRAGGAD